VIQVGPIWVGDNKEGHFEISGRVVEWHEAAELDSADLADRLEGRTIVAARLDHPTAFLRLDDGSHVAFQGYSAQSEDGLDCLLWEDDPPGQPDSR
jgi:hypothetical protein